MQKTGQLKKEIKKISEMNDFKIRMGTAQPYERAEKAAKVLTKPEMVWVKAPADKRNGWDERCSELVAFLLTRSVRLCYSLGERVLHLWTITEESVQ